MRKDLGFDFCRNASDKNPYVAGPLKRTDCSLVSDGAAALILADEDTAKAMPRAIRFRGAAHVNEMLPLSRRDPTRFEGGALAWQQALEAAELKLGDLSFVETHDCFTIAELIEYEAMGLVPEGQGCARGAGGLDRGGWQAADQPVGRAEGQGPPDRRHRRVHARDRRDAARGRGGGDAVAQGRSRRRVQHGRRRGRKLRHHPGAYSLTAPKGGVTPISRRVMNLSHFLRQNARRHPADPALIWGERSWSWAEMDSRVDAMAAALAASGLGKGDRILVQSRNCNQMFESMFACFRLGAVWVPANFRQSPSEVAYLGAASGASAMICGAEFPEHAAAAAGEVPGLRLVVSIGAAEFGPDYDALVAQHLVSAVAVADVEYDDPCWFFFTSGTTGRPKARRAHARANGLRRRPIISAT